jgi:hypothetical protein
VGPRFLEEDNAEKGQPVVQGSLSLPSGCALPSPLQTPTLDGAQQHLLFLGGGTGIIGGQEAADGGYNG